MKNTKLFVPLFLALLAALFVFAALPAAADYDLPTIDGKSEWLFGEEITLPADTFYYYNYDSGNANSTGGIGTLTYKYWSDIYKQHIVYLYIQPTEYWIYLQPVDFEAEEPMAPTGIRLVSGDGTEEHPYRFALLYAPTPYVAVVTSGAFAGEKEIGFTADGALICDFPADAVFYVKNTETGVCYYPGEQSDGAQAILYDEALLGQNALPLDLSAGEHTLRMYENGNGALMLAIDEAPVQSYGLAVNGVEVTEVNCGDILGNGTASFDPDTRTLSLDGFAGDKVTRLATYDACGVICSYGGDLLLDLSGENTVTCGPVYDGDDLCEVMAVCAYGGDAFAADLTVQGTGTLEIVTTGAAGGSALWASNELLLGALLTATEAGDADVYVAAANFGVSALDGYSIYAGQSGEDLDFVGETYDAALRFAETGGYDRSFAIKTDLIYTVAFDTIGGSPALAPMQTQKNGKLAALPSPAKNGYRFIGWYTDPADGDLVTADTLFDSDSTLFAHYVKKKKTPVASTAGLPQTPETSAPQPPANPFTDVSEGDYFYEAVLWAYETGVTVGMSGTTFDPDAVCTRAQTVTFLWRALGMPAPATDTLPFTDVSKDDYFYTAVLWAYENGVTVGTTETTFDPDGLVTRAQAITLLYRLKGEKTAGQNRFTDVKETDYFCDAVLWGIANGLISGVTDTTFGPHANSLRAQTVTLLWRCR